jgi:diacylglycerol O-acyltransferase-1
MAGKRPQNGSATANGQPSQQKEHATKQLADQWKSARYKHIFAVHSLSRPSLFSPDTTSPPDALGFRNLMGLVILFSNLRLMVDNFQKYGLLVTVAGAKVRSEDWYWSAVLYALTPCHLFIAYVIEYLASQTAVRALGSKKKNDDKSDSLKAKAGGVKETIFSTWTIIALLHALNATVMLVYATHKVYNNIHNPGLGTIAEMHSVIVWLKVCSYAFTNRDLRHAMLFPDPSGTQLTPALYKSCPYPRNINFGNLCYFWWAPTLVYQPVYPRSEKIRWDFVFRRLCEFSLLCILIFVTSAQYAAPLLNNSLDDISQLRVLHIMERIMKLSTISLVCWLAGFFAIFQSLLNALAELMRFGDREFYGDWWNSSTVRGKHYLVESACFLTPQCDDSDPSSFFLVSQATGPPGTNP